jgi:hypothetical protein
MLEDIGQPYRTELLDYDTTMKAAAYLAINPMGKVPAIRHGDIVVTEAAAICAYLADVFPEARLAPPAGDRLRGPYYRWLFFAAGPVEAAWSNKAMGFVVPQGRERMMGYGRFETADTTTTFGGLCARVRARKGCNTLRHHARSHPRGDVRLTKDSGRDKPGKEPGCVYRRDPISVRFGLSYSRAGALWGAKWN